MRINVANKGFYLIFMVIILACLQHISYANTSFYDEQLGLSFTQNWTSLAYNVTAIPQNDTSEIGPAYLLNGYSNQGYWYQVGLSYNWITNVSTNYGHTNGFRMNYEVFKNKSSIFPLNGYGGIAAFSGPVNPNDTILLSLQFSNGYVIMQAKDWNTGAYATESFSSYGANLFVGEPDSIGINGSFTGLMTEWYHTSPYYDNEKAVRYKSYGQGPKSAWFWIDEFTCTDACYNKTTVFSNLTYHPIFFNSSTYSFSYQGANEYANSNYFITGLTSIANTLPASFNSNLLSIQSTGLERVYMGQNLSTGPIVVQLDKLSGSGLASISTYDDGLLLYRGGIFPPQTATIETSLGRIIVYINSTQTGSYTNQNGANMQIIVPYEPVITSVSTTVYTSTTTEPTTSLTSIITSTIIPNTTTLKISENSSNLTQNNPKPSAGSLALGYTIIALAIFAVLYISFRLYRFVKNKISLRRKKH